MSKGTANSMPQPKDSDPVSGFFKCPRGHKLPHRVKGKGRCAPFDCCEARGGAHAVVRDADKADHAEALAYAEETMELTEMKDRMRAWNEAHPVPELPPPAKTSSIREYMEKRLEQVAPLALERRIRKAVLDPGHAGEQAARELLNRGGYSERPELKANYQGPVLIVNISAEQMKAQSPYASQGKQLKEPHHVDGEIVAEVDAEDAARNDAPGTPAHVARGEGND